MQPQQFVLLSATSVERWSEQLDLPLDVDALAILTEDLNFRLRQLAHDASQHMRHSGRRRITPGDIDRALQWCNFGPACGLGYRTSTAETDYVQVDDMAVPVYKTLDLENALDVQLDLEVEPALPTCVSQWALVDGRPQLGVEIDYPEGQRRFDAFTSVHGEYLEQAVQAIMSDSDEATALIIDDLASNPNLSILLPSLLNSISVGLRQYHHDLTRMFKLLGAFKAILNNDYLLLTTSTSLPACLQVLYYCLREPLALEATDHADELTFRMKAAYVTQFFIETNSNSSNRLEAEITGRLLDDCLEGNVDALFGALFTLRLLGKGRWVLKKLPALIAVIGQLEQQHATAAKACLARGFLQDFARIEVLNGQTALLHNDPYRVDYAAFEEHFGGSLAAMLCPLTIGKFMFRPLSGSGSSIAPPAGPPNGDGGTGRHRRNSGSGGDGGGNNGGGMGASEQQFSGSFYDDMMSQTLSPSSLSLASTSVGPGTPPIPVKCSRQASRQQQQQQQQHHHQQQPITTSILRSQLIRRSPISKVSSLRDVFDVADARTRPQAIRIEYGRAIVTESTNRRVQRQAKLAGSPAKTGAGGGGGGSKLAAVLAKHSPVPSKRLMLIRGKRSWTSVFRSCYIACVL